MFEIKKAEKKALPVTVYLSGFSGSGKTFSALRMARGLSGSGKILMIGTEGVRAEMYVDHPAIGTYDVMPFEAPFTQERYLAALKQGMTHVGRGGTVIIDSLSDEHEGEGGLLDQADKNTSNNALLKWAPIKRKHKRLLAELYNATCNVIVCVRKYESTGLVPKLDKNGNPILKANGQPETESVAMQKDSAEKNALYPFTVGISLDKQHRVSFTKFPYALFGDPGQYVGEHGVIDEAFGQKLALAGGNAPADTEKPKLSRAEVCEKIYTIENVKALNAFYRTLPNGADFTEDFAARKKELTEVNAQ